MARGIFGRLFGGNKPDDAEEDAAKEPEPQSPGPEKAQYQETDTEPASEPAVEVDTPDPEPEPAVAEPEAKTQPEPEPEIEPEIESASEAEAKPERPTSIETESQSQAEIEPESVVEPQKRSWFQRLTGGLSKSSTALKDALVGIVAKRKLDAETLEELEDVLIASDLGVETAMTITESLAKGRYDKEIEESEIRAVLAEEVAKVLEPVARPLDVNRGHSPHVILIVGVNGTGKTTTIGKLAAQLKADGKSVLLAAGDTFRAAAIDQLKIWGERTGAPVVAGEQGADAAGLAFDALDQAIDQKIDVVLIDTAGRLQNKADLMAELEKVIRVIKKKLPEAPHDVVLVLDATTGQNALQQVEIFGKVAGVTGIVMTKLDGTARGGILVAISAKYQMPVHAIGVGEGIDDFQPFDSQDFARAIAGLDA
jgi:fused signal recognition particle receptor